MTKPETKRLLLCATSTPSCTTAARACRTHLGWWKMDKEDPAAACCHSSSCDLEKIRVPSVHKIMVMHQKSFGSRKTLNPPSKITVAHTNVRVPIRVAAFSNSVNLTTTSVISFSGASGTSSSLLLLLMPSLFSCCCCCCSSSSSSASRVLSGVGGSRSRFGGV